MKKFMSVSCLVLIYILFSSFALADTMIIDVDPLDTDVNPSNTLPNSNPTTEEAWLEGLLGYDYNNLTVNFIGKIEDPLGGPNQLTNYNPGFAWDYAVVKYGRNWVAYEDTGNDNLLTTDILPHGISHVSFFDPQPVSVPEPATILLLGSGLIGLWGLRKKFKR